MQIRCRFVYGPLPEAATIYKRCNIPLSLPFLINDGRDDKILRNRNGYQVSLLAVPEIIVTAERREYFIRINCVSDVRSADILGLIPLVEVVSSGDLRWRRG